MPRQVIALSVRVLVLAALAVVAWGHFFPSEEARIKERLEQLAEDLTEGTMDGVGGLARAARIGLYFTEAVVVEPGAGIAPIQGRQTVIGLAVNLQPRTGSMRVAIEDATVKLLTDQTADVNLTVTVRRNAGTSQETIDAREFTLLMEKHANAWHIARATSIDTLR